MTLVILWKSLTRERTNDRDLFLRFPALPRGANNISDMSFAMFTVRERYMLLLVNVSEHIGIHPEGRLIPKRQSHWRDIARSLRCHVSWCLLLYTARDIVMMDCPPPSPTFAFPTNVCVAGMV